MIEHLFFNFEGSFSEVAERFFGALGLSGYQEGDSANVAEGIYYDVPAFGVSLSS